ncbi:natriuretic peptides A isoform X1 [Fundulus heteroclitus]|uniref:Natriuretic peptide A n=1 Tax=Fundulus heteroclitus TaxID=8078 RepID=A0A3Q2P7I4_FUNHE|nr:natriuretic peptides A isoform X1 [Fundulus heteroclitus]
MKAALVFTVLAVFWQQCLVRGHVLGRPSLTSNLDQLKTLLERFEESLAEEARKEELDADYEETNQEPEQSQTSRGWSLDPEGDRDNQMPEAAQPSAVGQSRTASQRNRLKDLLLSLGKRASSCFGARMDRIGNVSGLGCNSARGTKRVLHAN